MAARFRPIGGQDSKSEGLGGSGAAADVESYGTETGRTGNGRNGPETDPTPDRVGAGQVCKRPVI